MSTQPAAYRYYSLVIYSIRNIKIIMKDLLNNDFLWKSEELEDVDIY